MKAKKSTNLITRRAARRLAELAVQFPVVMVTGPRQSGKTTLCRMVFPDHPWVSLEDPSVRRLVQEDPRGFLERYANGAIFDEVQRVPELTSYLQGLVDRDPAPGRYILTGSQHFGLTEAVSQSLAGRAGLLELMPLGLDEVWKFPRHPEGVWEVVWTGGYPAIYHRGADPAELLGAYISLYLERDVRQVLNVADLGVFQDFVHLLAGRATALLNLSGLGADAGISHNTARAWLGVLEASYLVKRLRPVAAGLRKRLVRTPRVYFLDTGVLCRLLGITEPGMIFAHPMRGALFENWVVAEVLKWLCHTGSAVRPGFYRDRSGNEVDLVLEAGDGCWAVEIKSARTFHPDFILPLERFGRRLAGTDSGRKVRMVLVYAGDESFVHRGVDVVAWRDLVGFLDNRL